jgi:hypothetical protein
MGRIDKLPRIFKTPSGDLQIIYRNRVEYYKKGRTYTKSDIDSENPGCCYDYENIHGRGWNASHEVDMMRANGFREIHPRGE